VRTYIVVAFVFGIVAFSSRAEARPVRFAGAHPVAAKFGGGFCYIESPHLHGYSPDRAPLYQQVNDHYVFTGDPTPFGYEGDKHKYYGHHPVVQIGAEPLYCYLDGPHFHAAEPPDQGYEVKSGVAFYVGPFTPGYARIKPQRVKMVNAEYRPYTQYRPVVEVQPPPEWHGEVYVAPPSVEVSAPGIVVNAPAPPSIVLNAPPPPVVVAPPPPHVQVVAPPPPHVVIGAPAPHVRVVGPPPPHVVVGAPAPHIVVGAPRPHGVVVAPAPGVVVVKGKHGHGAWKGNNGKHKGWYK
jgi:hypothetical protein